MKCIRLVGQGLPVRIPDDQAYTIVEIDKDGEYCSKTLWKRWQAGLPLPDPHRWPERARP